MGGSFFLYITMFQFSTHQKLPYFSLILGIPSRRLTARNLPIAHWTRFWSKLPLQNRNLLDFSRPARTKRERTFLLGLQYSMLPVKPKSSHWTYLRQSYLPCPYICTPHQQGPWIRKRALSLERNDMSRRHPTQSCTIRREHFRGLRPRKVNFHSWKGTNDTDLHFHSTPASYL